jgi:excinuclease UvrABC nuclease subunit
MINPLEHHIYLITNTRNGKVYVGRASCLKARIATHFSGQGNGVIGREIRMLGPSAFTWRVLDTANSVIEAAGLERLWIHLLEANDPKFGYNSPRINPWPRRCLMPRFDSMHKRM